ncbi:MAG: hypothetical protein KAT43_04600 [Nanoarchaeota archaeon]|nr:hypothetical protein [Nanoarchaeota archaeon]
MGIGERDKSGLIMEFPEIPDWDKDPKSTVSFQPEITLVEQGRLGSGASNSNLMYGLKHGKTILVATENLTMEGPQLLRDLSDLSPDIRRQAAEHFKGRVIDPRKFDLEDFVWAMDLLNRTYEYSKFPDEHLEVWRKCFGLVEDMRYDRRMFKYPAFVGSAAGEDFPDVQIAIHPVYISEDREIGPTFPGRNALISGFTIYAAFELGKLWSGKEENLQAAVQNFIGREKERSGRLSLRVEKDFPREYFAVGIPKGPEDEDRNIYVSWSNWDDYAEFNEAKETLPDLYERGVPQQIAYLGQIVSGFLAEKDKRETEDFAQAMSDKALAIKLSRAKEGGESPEAATPPKDKGSQYDYP